MTEVVENKPRRAVAAAPPSAMAAPEGSPVAMAMAALSHGLSPADLREMLAVQREWEADRARAAFNEAKAAFSAEALTVFKGKQVKFGDTSYKHAELSDVVNTVTPVLSKYGLSFAWEVDQQATGWIVVTCVLSNKAGHSTRASMGGPPDQSGKKNVIQQIASTITYLQRYTLKAVTGVAESGDDNDGHGGAEAKDKSAKGLPNYSAEKFAKNLPTWRANIAEGKNTADEIILFISTKGTLSVEQIAAIKEPQA